jgi:hypothetical protein
LALFFRLRGAGFRFEFSSKYWRIGGGGAACALRRYSGMERRLTGTFIGLESPLDFFALTHCSRCQPNDPHDSTGEEQDVVRGASRARIP